MYKLRAQRPSSLPPLAPGLPVVGNLLPFLTDPLPFMLRAGRQVGPVYRIRMAGKESVVVCGDLAWELASRRDTPMLSGPAMVDFAHTLDTDQLVIALDGEPHARLRRMLGNSHARASIEAEVPTLVRLTDELVDTLRVGDVIDPMRPLKQVVTRMLGLSMAGVDSADIFDDLMVYFRFATNVTLIGIWPRLALRHPRYLRAKESLLAFTRRAIASRPEFVPEEQRNVIDDLRAARDEAGNPLPEHMFNAAVVGTFIAGLDTVANTAAFGLYAVLRDPVIYERLVAEIDEVFTDDVPSRHTLRKMRFMTATVNEILRRYNPTVALLRHPSRDVEVGGYTIPAGMETFLYPGSKHFDADVFPDPWRFDPDRFLPPRNEHKAMKGAYVPFGIGPHRCLGAAAGEVTLLVLLARLLRRVRFALEPKDYETKIRMGPLRMPDRQFRVRVVAKR